MVTEQSLAQKSEKENTEQGISKAFAIGNRGNSKTTDTDGFYKSSGQAQDRSLGSAFFTALENKQDGLAGGDEGGSSKADNYLETIANVSFWLERACDKKAWFIPGECAHGHRFAKEIACGKEWCLVCGEDGSVAHNRRFARWLPKIMKIETMGYFVFTLPEEVRSQYRTKKALSRLGHQVQGLLKSFGFNRGLRRWHWFGDRSSKWHPHLNCLVDGGFICSSVLDAIKGGYASLLGVNLADVNYRYRCSPGRMVHALKYITRSTFRDYEWDIDMSIELRGFRNMVVWGRGLWDGEAVWSLSDLKGKAKTEVESLDIEAILSLTKKVCSVCGEPIKWGKALPIGLLDMADKQSLGAGYWRVFPDAPVAGGLSDDLKEKLDWMELVTWAGIEVELMKRRERAEANREAEAEYQEVLRRDLLNGRG